MRVSLEAGGLTARAARVPTVAHAPVAAICLVSLLSLHDGFTASSALLVAATLTASVAGFLLDDEAADITAASPTTFAWRRLRRVALGGAVLTAGWVAVLVAVRLSLPAQPVPIGAASLEAAALASVTLGLSAIATRISGVPGGLSAALCLLPLMGLVAIVGRSKPDWPLPELIPGSPRASRWWWVLAAGLAVVACLSRDPGAPGPSARAHWLRIVRRGRSLSTR